MDIFPMDQVNIPVEGTEFTNFSAGVTLKVRECEDKSGFIGKLYDAFTGDLIRNFFGSGVKTVCIAANNHVNKFKIYEYLAN